MTQDERWQVQWKQLMDFMDQNHRRPSKFIPEERPLRNWWKHQQKLMNAGVLKEDRVSLFRKLVEVGERYKRKNQFA